MKKYPISVEGFDGTLEELAQCIGGMCYDKVVEFLYLLKREISRQAEGDRGSGRMKLHLLLVRAVGQIVILMSVFQDMVDGPCKKYIEAEKELEKDNESN